jgi:hypothetical protein
MPTIPVLRSLRQEDHSSRPAQTKASEILSQKQARHGSKGMWSQLLRRRKKDQGPRLASGKMKDPI